MWAFGVLGCLGLIGFRALGDLGFGAQDLGFRAL